MTAELVTPEYVNAYLTQPYPMTVGTLIAKLQTCNPNKPVRVIVDGFNEADIPEFGVAEGPDDVSIGRLDESLFTIELSE